MCAKSSVCSAHKGGCSIPPAQERNESDEPSESEESDIHARLFGPFARLRTGAGALGEPWGKFQPNLLAAVGCETWSAKRSVELKIGRFLPWYFNVLFYSVGIFACGC